MSINKIKSNLQEEITTCTKTLHKYQKAYNVINTISLTAGSLAGASGIITSATIPNPIIALPTASVSAILGSITLVTGLWNRILLRKIEKYECYISTAQSKLNSIEKKLSQSLNDEKLTAEEHLLCITEWDNYLKLKQDIRTKHKFHKNIATCR